MQHENDYCEGCYVFLGGELHEVPKPPCLTCNKPLFFDVFERYKESHNSTKYGCDDCKK